MWDIDRSDRASFSKNFSLRIRGTSGCCRFIEQKWGGGVQTNTQQETPLKG